LNTETAVGWPAPARLRVEGLEQWPQQRVVLSEAVPRFSFSHGRLAAGTPRGLGQQAYRIVVQQADVATSPFVVWNSGVVRSVNSSNIAYAADAPLRPFESYTWITAWQATDERWSANASATFETGPIAESDWGGAEWLTGSQLRMEFQLPDAVVLRARAYVAAAGCHSLEINGHRPSPDLRGVCAWTVLRKRVLYQTHDITSLLRTGANAVGIMSNGLDARDGISTPLVRAILRVEVAGGAAPLLFHTFTGNSTYEGGTEWRQADSWATMAGAGPPAWIRGWQMQMNWTAEEPGWSSATGAGWRPIRPWSPAAGPSARFAAASPAQQMPVAAVVRRVAPVNVTRLGWPASNGSRVSWVYTFPRNLVGMVELQPLPGAAAGASITLVHGEWLEKDVGGGNWRRCERDVCTGPLSDIMPVVSGGGDHHQTVVHTLRANNTDALSPLFAWHGFQYVKVVADTASSFAGGLQGLVVLEIHPNLTETGQLAFGGDGVPGSASEDAAAVLGGIQTMLLRSQLANLAAYIPTSCPTTEKQGWLGDALFAAEASMYNFDLEAIYTSWLASIEDNQGSQGDVPYLAPGQTPSSPASCNDIAWTSAYPRVTSFVGAYYGATRAAARHWPSLTRYVDNLVDHHAGPPPSGTQGGAGVATCDQFLDWVTAGACDTGMCQTMFSPACESARCPVGEEVAGSSYVLGLRAMATLARQLGRADDAQRYAADAAAATIGFHARFWNTTSQAYGSDLGGQQMLAVPAMAVDAMPTAQVRDRMTALLREDLHNRSGHHLQVGAVSSKSYLNVLSGSGLHAEALRVATQRTEPGWGWWLAMGATTCWEKWPGDTSRNHIFLCGGFGEWLWKYVIGLRHSAPGFATAVVEPHIDGIYGPSHASGTFRAASGEIFVGWSRSDTNGSINVRATLPTGVTSATVRVPAPFGPLAAAPVEVVCASGSELGAKQVAINHFNAMTDFPKVVNLECSGGGTFRSIDFASFGDAPEAGPEPAAGGVSVDCGGWSMADDKACHANSSVAVVERICLNQTRCSIAVNSSVFGGDPCYGVLKSLSVRATCAGGVARGKRFPFQVKESGRTVWDGSKVVEGCKGIISVLPTDEFVEFEVMSGDYKFEASAPPETPSQR
jgi:alpha-L-rhamnosidase